MNNVYEECPVYEDDKYLLRFVQKDDAKDLISVYGDKNALPFFNSDNCHGDFFYYPDIEKMDAAVDFWLRSYEYKCFVRWTIIDKKAGKAIGAIELFHRKAEDELNHVGVLRIDLGSAYEKEEVISDICKLIVEPAFELFECDEIGTKVPLYAVERKAAFGKLGFKLTDRYLIGSNDKYAYKDYWVKHK